MKTRIFGSLLLINQYVIVARPQKSLARHSLKGDGGCLITRQVALQGAMRILLVLLSMIRSYPAIATGYAWTFVSPVVRGPVRELSQGRSHRV